MVEALPRSDAVWPWRGAADSSPYPGVEHWHLKAKDGAEVDLLKFDLKSSPRLRLELYDQDQDSDHPFGDDADFASRGVGQIVRHLNDAGRGRVVAAWNGLFFSYSRDHLRGKHIGAEVIDGKAHYNFGSPRWAFGVSYRSASPVFKVLHSPDIKTMEREFDYGAVGAQCLVREGKPLRLQPFPKAGDPPLPSPVPSTEREAGHIPVVDFIQTSRISMGWSKDSRYLYLLIVDSSRTETESALALRHGGAQTGGWTLKDIQRFWLSLGVWGAVNSDGGVETQFAYLRSDGHYILMPSRLASPNERLTFGSDLKGAPNGGSLMTFYVRALDAAASRQ
jgi:hypothetical protein